MNGEKAGEHVLSKRPLLLSNTGDSVATNGGIRRDTERVKPSSHFPKR